MNKRICTSLMGGCFVLLSVVLLSGCSAQTTARETSSTSETPKHPTGLTVITPQKKVIARTVEQPGTLQPYEETTLYARVPGYVLKVHADIGKKVKGPQYGPKGEVIKAGEILAEIDVPEMVEEAKQKRALVRKSEAEVEQSCKALAAAEANVKSYTALHVESKAGITRAKANLDRWTSESRRISALVRQGVIDQQTGDETENQLRAATAGHEEAKARVTSADAAVGKAAADRDRAKADVAAMAARVDVARADQGKVEAMLAYAKIRAPFDGVVTRRKVNTGDYVSATSTKPEGVFTVSRLDPVRVVVAVPEADAGMVDERSTVELTVGSGLNPPIKTKVARTSWSLDPGTRTLRVEMDLDNKEGKYRPGMYVYARLKGQAPPTWTLPSAAVVKQGDSRVCFMVTDGKAIRTLVEVGRSDANSVEVLSRRSSETAPWQRWTGKENVVSQATGVIEGQAIKASRTGQ